MGGAREAYGSALGLASRIGARWDCSTGCYQCCEFKGRSHRRRHS